MIKINKNGFTLSEALIALSVIGVLALLILPGVIKDSTNKAFIALLQGTVEIVNEAIQNEIIRTRATDLGDTKVYMAPEKFIESIDTVSSSANDSNFNSSYKSLNGTAIKTYSCQASAILRNGTSICIHVGGNKNTPAGVIYIDVNGNKKPNIAGVDLFGIYMPKATDVSNFGRLGDIGGNKNKSDENVQKNCKDGQGDSNGQTTPMDCYAWLERSGFNQNYLNEK